MLKLPKKTRSYNSYYNSSYYNKGKTRPKISVFGIIVAIPVLIVLSEFLAQTYLAMTGQGDETKGTSPLIEAYKPQFRTATNQAIEGLKDQDQGELLLKRSSTTGYEFASPQKSEFFYINEQGLRDNDPVPLAKPKNEIRIFVLGGSTAFGQLNPNNNSTISHQLEARLQQRVKQQKSSPSSYRPDVFPFFVPSRQQLMKLPPKIREGNYRVINAAVPGYSSGNQLAQLATKILPYQPDLIVVLDGYGDMMLSSNMPQSDIPNIDGFLADAKEHFKNSLNFSADEWIQNTGLVRTYNSFTNPSKNTRPVVDTSLATNTEGKALKYYLPENEDELKLRINRYRENHKRLIQLSAKMGVPVVLAIQPEITSRPLEKLSSDEKAVRDRLGTEYLEKFPKAYTEFVKATQQLGKAYPKNVKVLNFYQSNSNFPTPMFTDSVHLTEKSNTVLAETLYHAITAWEKIQIVPQNFYLKN
ncbi:MAG: SGNH/GDSL hydrolase family protein [Crocosphaera sp.]|nr:SGNH/GDSL hydrolase family protein [Crocosphaera sp.]